MASSTSTFRTEWKVVATVVLMLAAIEVIFRAVPHKLSGEIASLTRGVPAQAARLAKFEGRRVLVLGNSMTEWDLDEALAEELDALTDSPTAVEVMHWDGAGITEWYHLVKKHFAAAGRMPDAIVLNFHVYSPEHPGSEDWGVRDESVVNTQRLIYHVDRSDVCEVVSDEYKAFGDRCHFVHIWLLQSAAGRGRIQTLVMLKIVPGYMNGLSRLGELSAPENLNKWALAQQERAKARAAEKAPPKVTYNRFRKLAELAEASGTDLLLVAMPYRDVGQVPPLWTDLGQVVKLPFGLFDLHDLPSLTDEMYKDRSHLNEAGRALFQPIYVRKLASRLNLFDAAEDDQ